ncbi:NADPH-dependent 7-cyano-7-deazaguanine reductase [Psychrosphaera saromensis]|uniref:NADPH-dependent 7-cyano-7-deazaguanine reductase n=1 Tax=Psychrosphaera saromensis TaxID=716813 RepID=A0A2S7UWE3_9GAMM|nr:NADPH-dependent 7-cyano-7-deazaguanine reductase QueF [Psychrosphaera saromensis]PQJ54068.1 NADPH-dependent 7-cyano-7-deazaguanine reductase QueF [Psychrosphaera saromensis]GHB76585.1 NADPH-dependent 7-cyano-7-deazaguanine reductase [Psychrosphaera saromensis]GLQ14434.1 NADPH-dependent 7-cyano-7-deazaguanine reductase [Psychrosphaera saromensis]
MTSKYTETGALDELTLGKQTAYETKYNPKLLQPVPRSLNRDDLNLSNPLPFYGHDLWTGYEVSWLNAKGKPVVAIAEFVVPATSANLIESKSFKLYLNSFNQTKFANWDDVQSAMVKDLSQCAGQAVDVDLLSVDQVAPFQVTALNGNNIDELDIEIDNYDFNNQLLQLDATNIKVTEELNSHLLKSNCLITSQPDWASIVISYTGLKIDHESLLRYLISFRMHNEFHEQCVERIFTDIQALCKPSELTVYARYTRRGGLDINPYRTTSSTLIPDRIRTNRQ